MSSSCIDYRALALAIRQVDLEAATNASVGANNGSSVKGGSGHGPAVSEGSVKVESGSGVGGAGELSKGVDAVCDVGHESSSGDDSVVFVTSGPGAGDGVKRVQFGGLGDVFPACEEASVAKSSYFKSVVRGARSLALRVEVERLSGAKLPKLARESLAVCTFTAGTMPDVVAKGKQKLRSLAAVGDATLTLQLMVEQWSGAETVETAQAARSRLTSGKHLNRVMVESGLVQYVAYPPGVDPDTTTATATAFEAILGVLALYRPAVSVRGFLAAVGLLQRL